MLYKGFLVEGIATETVLDDGLVSLVDIPVHINAVLINTTTHLGNVIEGWIGNRMVLEVYDHIFDTQEETAADTNPLSSTKIIRLPVEMDIPAGQTFKIGIRSGAAESDICGAYEYTEKT
jgi:hypothetical protein